MYVPSVCPIVRVSCLSAPQPPATSAAARTRTMSRRRVMTGGSLDPRDRGSRAPALVVLEDAAQPPQALAGLALEPAAEAERLDEPVGGQLRLGLEHELDARAAARGLELPARVGLDAVELAAAADRDDLARRIDLDEGEVAPAEALERPVHLVAGARPAAVGVDAGEPPVLQVVVRELGMVRDVREVLEHLLAGAVDRDGELDGVHGPQSSTGRCADGRGRPACARASARARCAPGRCGGAAVTALRRSPARRGSPARRPAAYGGSARSGAVRR